MVLLNPGAPRNKITIQETTQTQSSTGMVTDSWSTYAVRYAAIKTMGGREGLISHQTFGQRSLKFILDYDSLVREITSKMRVSWDSRTFDIRDVENINEDNREVVLVCTERNV